MSQVQQILKVLQRPRSNDKFEVSVDSTQLEKLSYFNYLGSILTSDGRCTKDISTRITVAKQAFITMKSVLCDTKVPFALRYHILCWHFRTPLSHDFSILPYIS